MTKTQARALYKAADAAGKIAADAVAVAPMIVVQRANPFDDNSPIVKQYAPVMDGVCGFAWISVRPANSAFANWLRAQGLGKTDSYAGGLTVWVHDYNQSLTRKSAYAQAFAGVLYDAGIKAYANSRMD